MSTSRSWTTTPENWYKRAAPAPVPEFRTSRRFPSQRPRPAWVFVYAVIMYAVRMRSMSRAFSRSCFVWPFLGCFTLITPGAVSQLTCFIGLIFRNRPGVGYTEKWGCKSLMGHTHINSGEEEGRKGSNSDGRINSFPAQERGPHS